MKRVDYECPACFLEVFVLSSPRASGVAGMGPSFCDQYRSDLSKMKLAKFNRISHRWGSVLIALPLVLVIATGILLMLKKQSSWIQPPTVGGSTKELKLTFDEILAAAQSVPEAGITSWDQIDRLDVRPSKGMIKVRGTNRWEIQLDAVTAEVLHVAYRRSDLIESLHDGSFFNDKVKLYVFLPSGIILFLLWVTGLYLFAQPYLIRRKRRRRATPALPVDPAA